MALAIKANLVYDKLLAKTDKKKGLIALLDLKQ